MFQQLTMSEDQDDRWSTCSQLLGVVRFRTRSGRQAEMLLHAAWRTSTAKEVSSRSICAFRNTASIRNISASLCCPLACEKSACIEGSCARRLASSRIACICKLTVTFVDCLTMCAALSCEKSGGHASERGKQVDRSALHLNDFFHSSFTDV